MNAERGVSESSQLSPHKDFPGSETGHMSQVVSSMGTMTLSNKEVSHFSAQSTNDPVQTASSAGHPFTSEEVEFRDENVSLLSSNQFDTKGVSKFDDTVGPANVQSQADASGHVSRRTSTTEYIYTLLTEDTDPELVPLYSSWSLLCLGPATLYNPQKGISVFLFMLASCACLSMLLHLENDVDRTVIE